MWCLLLEKWLHNPKAPQVSWLVVEDVTFAFRFLTCLLPTISYHWNISKNNNLLRAPMRVIVTCFPLSFHEQNSSKKMVCRHGIFYFIRLLVVLKIWHSLCLYNIYWPIMRELSFEPVIRKPNLANGKLCPYLCPVSDLMWGTTGSCGGLECEHEQKTPGDRRT